MRRSKTRNMNKSSRLSHFHMIPLVLCAVMVIVYVLGMGTMYTVKGRQTAESLSITYDYDSKKASEYNYLTEVSEDLAELKDLAKDKDHALEVYAATETVISGCTLSDSLDETLLLIAEISELKDEFYESEESAKAGESGASGKNIESMSNHDFDADAEIQKLVDNLRTLRKEIASFSNEMENYDSSDDKYTRTAAERLSGKSDALLASIDAFLNINDDPDKNLMEEGNLSDVKTNIRSLKKAFCTLHDRLNESIELMAEADERMAENNDSVSGHIAELKEALSGCLNACGDQLATSFVNMWTENDAFGVLTESIKDRIADGSEDALAAQTVTDNNTNYNQRCKLSRDMAENSSLLLSASDDANYTHLEDSLVGIVKSSDGKVLFGPLPDEQDNIPSAWTNVLGSGGFSDFTDNYTSTRLLLDCYKEDIFPAVSYDIFKGLYLKNNDEITVTINDSLQEYIYNYCIEHGIKGDVLAYDYENGDILCMTSTEEASEDSDAVNLMNINLRNTSPGSTMKIVTLFLLESEGVDPSKVYYSCDGKKYQEVICSSDNTTLKHGRVNGVDAIAESCNIWFAHAIYDYLMEDGVIKDSVKQTLTDLGYQIVQDTSEGTETTLLGKLKRDKSVLNLNDSNTPVAIWNLIGEVTVEMSPIDMVVLSGLFAGGGKTAAARIVCSDDTSEIDLTAKYGEAFSDAISVWKEGYEQKREKELSKSDHSHYTYSNLPECITVAKTGTTQLSNDGDEQRLLSGFSEKYHVAFYIVINNYKVNGADGVKDDVTIATVANELFDKLEELGYE